jgi:hypothetical protein
VKRKLAIMRVHLWRAKEIIPGRGVDLFPWAHNARTNAVDRISHNQRARLHAEHTLPIKSALAITSTHSGCQSLFFLNYFQNYTSWFKKIVTMCVYDNKWSRAEKIRQ